MAVPFRDCAPLRSPRAYNCQLWRRLQAQTGRASRNEDSAAHQIRRLFVASLLMLIAMGQQMSYRMLTTPKDDQSDDAKHRDCYTATIQVPLFHFRRKIIVLLPCCCAN